MYGGAFPAQFSAPGDAHAMTKATSPQSFPSVPALCVDGRPFLTDPLTGRRYCACHMAPEGAQTHLHVAAASMKSMGGVAVPGVGPAVLEAAAMYDPMQLRGIPMHRLGPRGPHMTFDTSPAHPYGILYSGLDVHGLGMRKAATRETTGPLKIWLQEHRKNPYPTKAEKIMLAIITKMTLTQVSTWFANARRRLKKESRLYTSNDDNGDDNHDKDDDDDDRESSLKQNTDDDSDVDINVDISDISDSDSETTSRLPSLPPSTVATTTLTTATSCSSEHVTTSSSDPGAGTSGKAPSSLTSYLGPPYLPSYAGSPPYAYPRLSPPLAGVGGGAMLPAVSRHLSSPVVSSLTKLCLLLHPQLEQVFFPSPYPAGAAPAAPVASGSSKASLSFPSSTTFPSSSSSSSTPSTTISSKPKIWSISEIINSKAAAVPAVPENGQRTGGPRDLLQDTPRTASWVPADSESAFKLSPPCLEPTIARLSSAFSFPACKPDWLLPAVGARVSAEGHLKQGHAAGQECGSESPGVGFGSPSRSQSSIRVPSESRNENSVRVHSPQTEALDLHTSKQDKDFT